MAVTVASQLALVPVFLSFWSAETYGVWLALQTFYSLSTIVGMAHLTYLENEFIRIGKSDLGTLGRILWSSIPVATIIAIVQLATVVGLVKSGLFTRLVIPGGRPDGFLEAAAVWLAIAQVASWLMIVTTASLVIRMLCGIGYFSRYAWMGLPFVICNAGIPVIVLARGGGLLAVGLAQVATVVAFNLLWLLDGIRIAKREGIGFARPDLRLGFHTLHRSLYVMLRLFLEMARQTGFRLVMLPAVGSAKLAEFSTQRTVGNTAYQCMSSVYAPLLPEMMRYVREKKQDNLEGAFSILWLLLVSILCPLTVLLQLTMPTIFPWWTRKAFEFDGILLCYLSASVLVSMVSLPAMAICSGNNLVVTQFRIAAAAAALLLVVLIPMMHLFGIRGAALSLLISECAASAMYIRACIRWLDGAGLVWPSKAFRLCGVAVLEAIMVELLLAVSPQLSPWWVLGYFAASLLTAMRLWKASPQGARLYLADRLREYTLAGR